MRYLQRTKDYMLTYRKSDLLEVIGYSDSDFAGFQDSRKSTSGYVFLLAEGAISWKSVKQTLVASSTMEAEFVACYEASNQGTWLRNFVTGLRILENVERPLKLFCDNKSAGLYSNNNRSSMLGNHETWSWTRDCHCRMLALIPFSLHCIKCEAWKTKLPRLPCKMERGPLPR